MWGVGDDNEFYLIGFFKKKKIIPHSLINNFNFWQDQQLESLN